jgi:hypothetical protein
VTARIILWDEGERRADRYDLSVERPTAWERLRRVNPLVWDAVLALVVFGFSLFLEQQFRSSEHSGIDPWGRGLLALTCAPLVWRQLAPIGVLVATATGTVALQLWGYPLDFAGLAFVIAVYSAAAHRDRGPVFLVALPIAVAAALTIYLDDPPSHRDAVQLTIDVAFLVGVPMLFGRIEFNRRRRAREAVERASSDGVTEERARIARELHDVVAHSMGVMVVQAGAARLVVDKDPERAAAAMTQIEQTGRAGLAEMRRLLGILENANEAAPSCPSQASSSSMSSWRRCARPDFLWRQSSREPLGLFRRVLTSPPTGLCRRHSRTRSSTEDGFRHRCCFDTRTIVSRSRSPTTVRVRLQMEPKRRASDSSGCASG